MYQKILFSAYAAKNAAKISSIVRERRKLAKIVSERHKNTLKKSVLSHRQCAIVTCFALFVIRKGVLSSL